MSDKALRGNRLTAQGGGRIAGPARRAQEHGFYSPDMGMRGRFAIGGAAAKAAKIIKKKLMKPRGVFKVKGSKTHGKDVPTMAAEGGRIGFRTGTKPSAGQRIKARKAREGETSREAR